jgi:hypothetical protein
MDECPECKALDAALAAAAKRRDAAHDKVAPARMAGNQPRIVTPEDLRESRHSHKIFDEIRAKRTAHIKECARRG